MQIVNLFSSESGGSSPSFPTSFKTLFGAPFFVMVRFFKFLVCEDKKLYGVLVQLARTSDLHSEGPEFDSQRLHKTELYKELSVLNLTIKNE